MATTAMAATAIPALAPVPRPFFLREELPPPSVEDEPGEEPEEEEPGEADVEGEELEDELEPVVLAACVIGVVVEELAVLVVDEVPAAALAE